MQESQDPAAAKPPGNEPNEPNELIFISIAAYRDIQLVPTVEDLLAKAYLPTLLRFGICWQHEVGDAPLPFAGDDRFRILDVDWRDSRGACWARAEIMKLWQGEQYFFQIDSHCRVLPGWDTAMIRMMEQTGSPKPILSTYANAFTPSEIGSGAEELLCGDPQLMAIETFVADGLPTLKPITILDFNLRTRPMRARFLAAGFIFAPGSLVVEVPYDPELYFIGEEISMTLRAFTSGFDLFHPVEAWVFHDYVRSYAIRHWEDHVPEKFDAGAERLRAWGDLDTWSRRKVTQLLYGGPEGSESAPEGSALPSSGGPGSGLPGSGLPGPGLGRYGLGTERTREDYERYAGLSFALRRIQDYTRFGSEPPNPATEPDWAKRIYSWLIRLVVDKGRLGEAAADEGFWMVAIQDVAGREIYRHDFTRAELEPLLGSGPEVELICEMQSGIVPVSWTVWPCSRLSGWGPKLDGVLTEDQFSIVID